MAEPDILPSVVAETYYAAFFSFKTFIVLDSSFWPLSEAAVAADIGLVDSGTVEINGAILFV